MKYLNYVFPIAAALFLAACTTSRIPGLPKGAQVVGGGGEISWRAREAGTTIVVERTTRKVVKTGRVGPATVPFEFDVNRDAHLLAAMFPDKRTSDLDYVLYFVPDSKPATAK